MKYISLFFLIPALLLESSVTTIPLIFLVLLCLTVITKENWVIFYAFLFGLLFDLLVFKTFGLTSIYLLVSLFLVLIYQKKFEISTNYFVLASSFVGSLGFLLVLGYNNFILFQGILSSILGLIIFILLKKVKEQPNSSENL